MSLKIYADVIADRQINQTLNEIITNFSNKYVNTPCNSSLVLSFNMYIMSETEEKVGITSPFGGSVASDERDLAIDEGVPESSTVPNLQFVPDWNVVISEGEERVRRALAEVEKDVGRAEEASEGDSFVDIMGCLDQETGCESEGFTFADILQGANLLSETVLEGVVGTPDLPLC